MSKDYEKIADHFENEFVPMSRLDQIFLENYRKIESAPFTLDDLRDMFYNGYFQGFDDCNNSYDNEDKG